MYLINEFEKIINKIKINENNLYQKDFLSTKNKSNQEIENIIDISDALIYLYKNNISTRCFDRSKAILNLRDNSIRTEFLFSSACNLIGIEVQKLNENKSCFVHGESIRETLNMIAYFTDIIGICDFMQLGAGYSYMTNAGKILDESLANGVLSQRPFIINLLSDTDNPVHALADLQHIKNYFGSFEALKGKKLAISWAYSPFYGKPLSFPQSILSLMSRFGINISIAYPPGYDLIPDVVEYAKKNSKINNCTFDISGSMEDSFKDADIVCPLYWDPLSVVTSRSELATYNDNESLKSLEKDCFEKNAKFSSWECTEEMMNYTVDGKALLIHNLPLEISGITCHRGEVQDTVYEKYKRDLYKEESYMPYIIASIILACKFKHPAGKLMELKIKN